MKVSYCLIYYQIGDLEHQIKEKSTFSEKSAVKILKFLVEALGEL
jgi:hypothetical protein